MFCQELKTDRVARSQCLAGIKDSKQLITPKMCSQASNQSRLNPDRFEAFGARSVSGFFPLRLM